MENIKCPACGSLHVEKIDTDKYQCPYCGKTFSAIQNANPQQSQQQVFTNAQKNETDDNPGCLMNGLCFLVPLVGIISYFVKKDSQPNCAKSYLTWSIVSIILGFLLNIVASMAS